MPPSRSTANECTTCSKPLRSNNTSGLCPEHRATALCPGSVRANCSGCGKRVRKDSKGAPTKCSVCFLAEQASEKSGPSPRAGKIRAVPARRKLVVAPTGSGKGTLIAAVTLEEMNSLLERLDINTLLTDVAGPLDEFDIEDLSASLKDARQVEVHLRHACERMVAALRFRRDQLGQLLDAA